MKIKILHLINSMEPGGAESLLKSFLKNADTETFEYHLAYFYKTGSFLDGWEVDIQIMNFSRKGRLRFLSLLKLFAYMRENKFQVLHTHLVHAGIIGKLFGRALRIPVIVSTRHHEILPKSGSFLYRLDDYLSKKLNIRTISISKSVHEFMLKTGYAADKICLIPNGIDCDFFSPNPLVEKEEYSIVSTGRLVKEKNYDLLIDTVNILKKKYADIRCTIIGDGPLFNPLIQKITSLGLQENIHLCGAKPNETVKKIMQQKEIYLSTSIFEGLPISVLEAMALELPVIAPASGSIPNVIKDGESGFLIKSNSAEQLANAVRSLFRQPQMRETFGKAARRTIVEKYSVNALTTKTQALYIGLLENKNIL